MTAATHTVTMDLWRPRRAVSLRGARFHTVNKTPPSTTPGLTSVTMLGPRFTGRDANDQPFVITADTARRRPQQPSLIDLTNPRMEDANASNVVAKNGVYDETREVLDHAGDVVMTDVSGYVFNSETARMYVRENRVEGQTRIAGKGPTSELKADNWKVLDNGKHIMLDGNVWTRFDAAKPKTK
jgi:lipopolysaccharide export system protein LptC